MKWQYVKDAARQFGVCVPSVYTWAREGKVQSRRNGHGLQVKMSKIPRMSCGTPKLTLTDVKWIRKMESKLSLNLMARMIGVDRGTITAVMQHRSWKL